MLTTIERVLALQKNEIFVEVSTDGLAYLASIAEEAEFNDGDRKHVCPENQSGRFL